MASTSTCPLTPTNNQKGSTYLFVGTVNQTKLFQNLRVESCAVSTHDSKNALVWLVNMRKHARHVLTGTDTWPRDVYQAFPPARRLCRPPYLQPVRRDRRICCSLDGPVMITERNRPVTK